jgi:hypothetical protein
MKQPTNLTRAQQAILLATLANQATIAAVTPQRWWGPRDREEWEADRKYGPLWSPSEWFNGIDTNARCVELTRVLKSLEARKLVHTFRRPGRKHQHVRLTKAGEKFARQLQTARNGKTLKG